MFAREVRVQPIPYAGWRDALRLDNGTVELVIVPSIARIMRYAFVGGGPNVLWDNPTTRGQAVRVGDWPNIGGDKVWPWPQDEWPRRQGRAWPPPSASDQAPHRAEIVAPGTVRLTSPVLAGYGLRIVRDVRLGPPGTTQVTLRSRFEKVRGGADFPVAVWSITQVQVPELVIARLLPGSPLPNGYKMLAPDPWKSIRTAQNGFLVAERPTATSAKIGLDADLLAGVRDGQLFTLRTLATPPLGAVTPGERAQIYSQPDNESDRARGITPYIEMELTGPLKILRGAGESSPTLDMEWQLRRLRPGETDLRSVTALLRQV